jgi:hypothetical protein
LSLYNAAPRYTFVPASQTAAVIGTSGTIRVHGIIVSTTAGGTVTVLDSAGNTIETIMVAANNSFEQKTGWLADKGLAITTPANTTCTVFHSNPGA